MSKERRRRPANLGLLLTYISQPSLDGAFPWSRVTEPEASANVTDGLKAKDPGGAKYQTNFQGLMIRSPGSESGMWPARHD
jgi:hypothetical protein